MSKIYFTSLVIELTRRCNMHCAHCMRGEAENADISNEVIDKLLEMTEGIGDLTITGGEVALNPGAIRYLAKRINELNIPLDNLYVVTNGKEVTNEFISALFDLFLLTQDGEINGIALSQDRFHEEIPEENRRKLKMFSFFHEDDHNWDFSKGGLLNLGRARELSFPKREPFAEPIEIEDGPNDSICINSIVACTVHGDLLSGCDYEYCSTDDIKFGSVFHPSDLAAVEA